MNIVADQLSSKPSTQAMIISFITDMKEYFKKAPLMSEDKAYARILKIAETTQRYMPHSYCITNISVKLLKMLKARIDDKLEDYKQQQNKKQSQVTKEQAQDGGIKSQDIQALENIHFKLSKQRNLVSDFAVKRQVDMEFVKKAAIQTIQQLKQEIQESENLIQVQLQQALNNCKHILVFDTHMNNRLIINKIAASKSINVSYVKISAADYKLNQISISDLSSRIRKFNKVIISADCITKNGAIISDSGSLMVALAAKKYKVPIVALTRGFTLTDKIFIDQHCLLSQNPMRYFPKKESSTLKTFVAKKFDLIQSRMISQIVSQLGNITPNNTDLHFSAYYECN